MYSLDLYVSTADVIAPRRGRETEILYLFINVRAG